MRRSVSIDNKIDCLKLLDIKKRKNLSFSYILLINEYLKVSRDILPQRNLRISCSEYNEIGNILSYHVKRKYFGK